MSDRWNRSFETLPRLKLDDAATKMAKPEIFCEATHGGGISNWKNNASSQKKCSDFERSGRKSYPLVPSFFAILESLLDFY